MKKQISIVFAFLIITYVISCNKSSEAVEKDTSPGQVEISFQITSKSGSNSEIINAIVTIEDVDGNKAIDSKRVPVFYQDGKFICESLSLSAGDYLINGFLALNAEDEIIGVSPKLKYLSDFGDPIDSSKVFFSVQANSTLKLDPYFYHTYLTGCSTECYGYANLSFEVADSIEFYIGVFDSNNELTDAKLKIYSYNNDFIYEQELYAYEGNTTSSFDNIELLNKISIPQAGYSYKIVISKDCHYDYEASFSKEELRLHCCEEYDGPLLIQLESCDCRIPSINTSGISFVEQNVAIGGGYIEATTIAIKERGVCWSTSPNPTINDNIAKSGPGTGAFESLMTDLSENTTYYGRAYATTDCGMTTYGEEINFITLENGANDIASCSGMADFNAYPSAQIYPDATINIDNYSENDAEYYFIDFGDGNVTINDYYSNNFPYSYEFPGHYEIKLAIIKQGCTDTVQQDIAIYPSTYK
jgi:hypothetical protein